MKGKVLYRIADSTFLIYKGYSFYINGEKIVSVNFSLSKRLLSKIRPFCRLLRLEPRCTCKLDDNRFIVCFLHKLWVLNTTEKTFKLVTDCRDGWSDPLNLCLCKGAVYWGDYGNNPNHNTVNIYRVDADLKVSIVYTFEPGRVRHIHNVIWDEKNSQFYILTGDLEPSSGIYVADENWSVVNPILVGNQQYRAVMGFPTAKGLIYATDSVVSQNSIFLLEDENPRILSFFPGSCIYGCETKTHFVFSSTVEPPEGRGLLSLFSYKLGHGISDRQAHLITVRKSDYQVKEIFQSHKDFLPMKLFQYGSIMLPQGQCDNTDLVYYIMACQGDGKSNLIKLQ